MAESGTPRAVRTAAVAWLLRWMALGLFVGGIVGLTIARGRLAAGIPAGVSLCLAFPMLFVAAATPSLLGRWHHPAEARYQRTMRYTFPAAIREQVGSGTEPWAVRNTCNAPAAAAAAACGVVVLAVVLRLAV